MRAKRHNHEAAYQIVHHRALRDCKVDNSRHALGNLRWILSANERHDKLDATVLE